MYEISVLEGEEKNITRALWEKVFTEDSVDFLDYYYKYKCRDNSVYAIKQNDKAVSMLQRNPYAMKVNGTELTADYIVAVATDKEFRHQGLMSRLIKRALNDMSEQGRAFTFLMPAAEAIYTPFGFRFIYSQPVYRESMGSSKEIFADNIDEEHTELLDKYIVVPMTDVIFDRFSEQINSHLEQTYDVFAVRTREYFDDLTKQYKSDGGKVSCVLSEDKLIACFNWWLTDERAEITELICFESDRASVITCIKNYFRKTYQVNNFVIRGEVPESCDYDSRIMLRITNVQHMLELVRADKELRIKLSVKDRLIPQNNKTFLWVIDEKESFVSVIEVEDNVLSDNTGVEYSLKAASHNTDNFDCEFNIDIEDLALWLFMGVIPENNPDLKYIRPISKVFINEIV